MFIVISQTSTNKQTALRHPRRTEFIQPGARNWLRSAESQRAADIQKTPVCVTSHGQPSPNWLRSAESPAHRRDPKDTCLRRLPRPAKPKLASFRRIPGPPQTSKRHTCLRHLPRPAKPKLASFRRIPGAPQRSKDTCLRRLPRPAKPKLASFPKNSPERTTEKQETLVCVTSQIGFVPKTPLRGTDRNHIFSTRTPWPFCLSQSATAKPIPHTPDRGSS